MGKTKKAGLLARAVTCLAATIAIALGTASPAFAAGEIDGSVDTSNISVTVPTSIPCTMMADGTVVAPSDLSIVNSGDAVVMDAYTADAMGNAVDFTLDIGGTRALSRTGGKDSAPASFSVFDFSIHSLSTVAVALAFCGRRGLLHRLRRLLGVFRLFLEGDGGLDGLLVAALLPVQLVGRF